MENDDFPVKTRCLLPDRFIQGRETFSVFLQIIQNLLLPGRHQADQPFGQVGSHTGGPLGIQPEMGVDLLTLFALTDFHGFGFTEEGKTGCGIHNRQVGIGAGDHRQEGFHTGSIDQQGVRPGKRDHIGILQGVIMQTAGGLSGKIDYADILHPFSQVQRHEPDRIKAGDNGFSPGKAGEEEEEGEYYTKDFFHDVPHV